MHQPVLLFSEEVNFHASGWTMWTAPLLLLEPQARPLSRRDAIKKKKKKKKKRGTQTDGTKKIF